MFRSRCTCVHMCKCDCAHVHIHDAQIYTGDDAKVSTQPCIMHRAICTICRRMVCLCILRGREGGREGEREREGEGK